MSVMVDDPRLRRLSDVTHRLAGEHDVEAAFDGILDAARELTGAGYAALGVLNERRDGLERFHATGVDEETGRMIGHPPRGRGVLGDLVLDPRPLRLDDVTRHPTSYGFPSSHPVMHSFLGVAISIREVVCGNLYLAEKAAGAFNAADEEIAVVLAGCAATAIEMARAQPNVERRQAQ